MTWYEWQEAPKAEFAVLGDPVSHSWSPLMHSAALKSLGRTERYVAIRVPLGEFTSAMEFLGERGYVGVNCTVPLKEAAFQWCRETTSAEDRIRSVNTVRLSDRTGISTDGPGFMDTLPVLGVTPESKILLLGAGGSARAVASSLAQAGYSLSIFNRTSSRAEELVNSLEIAAEITEFADAEGFDVVINATSSNLSGSNLDVRFGPNSANVMAYDLMYSREQTPFLRMAELSGCKKCIDGRLMLVHQGSRALSFWTGEPPTHEIMLRALES
ncbi:MAG: shikimate dehydrogenase [Armatimonadetes bacterium]|nr:shikimate dehydrogenase [Armatimonadota bacterium]